MYELAKKSREAMKSKARRLAAEQTQKVDSSNWSPAPLLNADMKTGARPITKPSAKGIGESNAARDTKSAIGNATRGAFKDGGGVKKKEALGDIDPTPKRGAAQHYKRGGKAEGGSKLPSPYEAMRSEERRGSIKVEEKNRMPSPKEAAESARRVGDVPEGRKTGGKKWIAGAIKKPGALRKSLGVKKGETIPAEKLDAAAEKGGKLGQRARLAQTLKKLGKKRGGSVGLTVVIADKGQQQSGVPPMMPQRATPVPMPQMQGPPPGAVPPAPMPNVDPRNIQTPAARQAPIGLKTGGRVSKVAKSYKDMTTGAASGEGRLQKTDIEKMGKDAPARKTGGRITKAASSYKDMEAGTASGEGRLQKTDIAKKRKGAPTA